MADAAGKQVAAGADRCALAALGPTDQRRFMALLGRAIAAVQAPALPADRP